MVGEAKNDNEGNFYTEHDAKKAFDVAIRSFKQNRVVIEDMIALRLENELGMIPLVSRPIAEYLTIALLKSMTRPGGSSFKDEVDFDRLTELMNKM